jgi:basic membrane protein A
MTRATGLSAAALSTALILASCGAAPEEESGSATEAANADYSGCIVSDSGGFDDRSFNQSSYEGLKAAEAEHGITIRQAESEAETDFTPNVDSMVQQGCDLIVTVGFLLGDATADAAEANPETNFAIVDFQYEKPIDNVKPLIYDTAQAAFLAGYVAAGTTETGKVATYGGMQIPTVTIFMDGFVDGVDYYNKQHGTEVKALGWNKKAQTGTFVGDFVNSAQGKTNTQNFVNEGADIIMPVAGPVGQGTLDAAVELNGKGKDVKVIWVDSDGYETAKTGNEFILTSVMKLMGESVQSVIAEDLEDSFSNEPYVGTLENGGVALAPFHDLESAVSDELKSELEQLKQDIISGEVEVSSEASPK